MVLCNRVLRGFRAEVESILFAVTADLWLPLILPCLLQ